MLKRTLTRSVTLTSLTVLISSLAVAAMPSSTMPRDANRIHVTDVAGRVDVSTHGRAYDIGVGSTLLLPSLIVTGGDGALNIKQAETSISVAPDSEIEIPEDAQDGQLIARLVQYRGNVFYDVAKREVGKFRVETPYLVAVIKGTQFNVAVQNGTTTISLFEGRLEIRTPDDSEVIELEAGQIAIRSANEAQIRVVGMDDVGPAPAAIDLDNAARGNTPAFAGLQIPDGLLGLPAALPNAGVVNLALGSNDIGLNAVLGSGRPDGNIGADLKLDPTATLSAGVDLGSGSGSVDVGLDAGIDLGAASVTTGLGAGIDLGSGSVDIGLDAGVGLEGVGADAGLETSVDLGSGSIDVGLDTSLDLGGGSLDLGLDGGLDLAGGGLDLGFDLDGDSQTDIDVGETVDEVLDVVPEVVPVVPDLGGLLNGLL